MQPFRIGMGIDVHRFTPDRPLILGGIEVPHTQGLLGHSDADVLIHALCDALLGAAAMGDIGKHFPDTSKEWEGADSKMLLGLVVRLLEEDGWQVGNVDVTVCAQRPKLRPYIDRMRETLAPLMHITADEVSIKATTTEHLGYEGREEGISAHAVALIVRK